MVFYDDKPITLEEMNILLHDSTFYVMFGFCVFMIIIVAIIASKLNLINLTGEN